MSVNSAFFPYTHRNYVRYGFDGKSYNQRTSSDQKFNLEYQPCEQPPHDFRQELIRAAKLVRASTSRGLYVCLSGGMDSEVTLRSFLEAQIPVNAAILRFKNGSNDHDIEYALRFCREKAVPHQVFEIDLETFFHQELARFDFLQCCSPQFLPVIWLMEQIQKLGGCPIIGNGDVCLKRNENTNDFFFIEKEKYFVYYSFLIRNGLEGIPAFLQYTPELFLAFLRSKTVVRYVDGEARDRKMLSISKFKYDVYREFFDLEPREIFNGFEKLERLDFQYRSILETRFPGSDSEFRISYPDMVAHLSSAL